MTRDTIFALASGPGRAAIAVIRLSGPSCRAVLDGLLDGRLPAPRHASARHLHDPGSGEVLDQALVLWLPGPGTFTGEDQAELHVHGGAAVRAAILRALSAIPDCRPAGPGEFTRRAFLNGRMDLVGAEGIADLIEADTEAQRRQAMRQMEGALSRQLAEWRESALDIAASLEALLDFADESDIPSGVADRAAIAMDALRAEIEAALRGARAGERLRDGFTVVLAGPPNVGKSTLINLFARRDVAIVSAVSGTTRDAIEVGCDLDGLPVTFVDTAGIRESHDPIEREGIARARSRAEAADLVLWLSDAAPPHAAPTESGIGAVPLLRVWTKVDLAAEAPGKADPTGLDGVRISAHTGEGIEALFATVRDAASQALGEGAALITRERHELALRDVAQALEAGARACRAGHPELAAEDLRLALAAIGRVTGEVDADDVLDRIFGRFCIGK